VPDIRELSSIVNYGLSPTADPIFDIGHLRPGGPPPGPRYWSSTSAYNAQPNVHPNATQAFIVDFDNGFIYHGSKGDLFPIRAVRDGRCQP
jgi:hypothetical protein